MAAEVMVMGVDVDDDGFPRRDSATATVDQEFRGKNPVIQEEWPLRSTSAILSTTSDSHTSGGVSSIAGSSPVSRQKSGTLSSVASSSRYSPVSRNKSGTLSSIASSSQYSPELRRYTPPQFDFPAPPGKWVPWDQRQRYAIGIQGALLDLDVFDEPYCPCGDDHSDLLPHSKFEVDVHRDIRRTKKTMQMVVGKSLGNRLPLEIHDKIINLLVRDSADKSSTCRPSLLPISNTNAYLRETATRVNGIVFSYDPCSRNSFMDLAEDYETLINMNAWEGYAPPALLVVGLNLDPLDASRITEVPNGEAKLFARSVGAQHIELWPENSWEAVHTICTALLQELFYARKLAAPRVKAVGPYEPEEATRAQVVSALEVLEPQQSRFARLFELLRLKNVFARAKPSKLLATLQRLILVKRETGETVKRQRNRLRKKKSMALSAEHASPHWAPITRVKTPHLHFDIAEDEEDEEWIQDVIRCINEVDSAP